MDRRLGGPQMHRNTKNDGKIQFCNIHNINRPNTGRGGREW
jgi:hypothetical protein